MYRKIEPWMVKGGAVRLGMHTGIIRILVTALVDDMTVVLKMYIQPTGVKNAWPVNPNDVDSINELLSR